MSVGLVFLLIQTKTPLANYFVMDKTNPAGRPAWAHTPCLPDLEPLAADAEGTLVSVILLAEQIGQVPIDYSIETLGAPMALGAFFVAILILGPEAISGIRAALRNNLQRSVNILLGSVLATISLTIPAVLCHRLHAPYPCHTRLTQLGNCAVGCYTAGEHDNPRSVRTNILQGAVHLLLFFAYVMLIFQP
ncbi:MAG: hypothetical protein R3E50_02290 [Halioglobus sp.]